MKKSALFTFAVCLFAVVRVSGQQDPMFTKYFFNGLIYNPAMAGSSEHLSTNLIYRQQWLGLEGAPTTQSLTGHTPLRNEHIGLGLSMVNDKIGAGGTFDLNTAYAYRFRVGQKLKLSLGLQASITNWRGNWSALKIEDNDDVSFSENINRWLPNFGVGVYLYGEQFFAGIGCPRMLESDLRKADYDATPVYSRTYRHYYATVGSAFKLGGNDNLIFRPSVLLKSTGAFSSLRKDKSFRNFGSPTEMDVDLSFFISQTFWIGAAYRTALEWRDSSNDSADLWGALYFRNGLRIGAAYDLTLSSLKKANSGSFELMVGYEFDVKVKKVASPRYF